MGHHGFERQLLRLAIVFYAIVPHCEAEGKAISGKLPPTLLDRGNEHPKSTIRAMECRQVVAVQVPMAFVK